MWSADTLFIVPAMITVLVDWMRTDEREPGREDARLDRASARDENLREAISREAPAA